MSKLGTLLASTLVLGTANTAYALDFHGTPYTFTGSVVSATAACPYKTKATLAGYTLIQNLYNYPPPNYQQVLVGLAGPLLIFSAGGTADKMTLKIGNIPLHSGAISGNEQIIFVPSQSGLNGTARSNTIKGTYKGTANIGTNGHFSLNLTNSFIFKNATCTAVYNLSLAPGIPAHLLNLL